MAKIPIFVSDFISILRDEEAQELWEFLDGDPDAADDMIAHVAKTHKALAKKLTEEKQKATQSEYNRLKKITKRGSKLATKVV